MIRALAIVTILAGIVVAQIPSEGLVAFYPFSGNPNDMVSGNNLVSPPDRYDTEGNPLFIGTPSPVVDRFNAANSAYQFGKEMFLYASDAALPMGSAPRTISFWVKDGGATYNAPPSATLLFYGDKMSGGAFQILIRDGLGVCNYTSDTIKTAYTPINNTSWKHICVTYAPDTVAIYVNGVLFVKGIMRMSTASHRLGIGGMYSGANEDRALYSFGGKLDDIAIYNRSLPAYQIKALYRANSSINNPPTITSTPVLKVSPGIRYEYPFTVSHSDLNQTVSTQLLVRTINMNIINNCIYWSPSAPGTQQVSLMVTDSIDSDTQSYVITVEPAVGIKTGIIHSVPVKKTEPAGYSISGRALKNDYYGIGIINRSKKIRIK